MKLALWQFFQCVCCIVMECSCHWTGYIVGMARQPDAAATVEVDEVPTLSETRRMMEIKRKKEFGTYLECTKNYFERANPKCIFQDSLLQVSRRTKLESRWSTCESCYRGRPADTMVNAAKVNQVMLLFHMFCRFS